MLLVLSAAPSSKPRCHLRHTDSTLLLWRTPGSVLPSVVHVLRGRVVRESDPSPAARAARGHLRSGRLESVAQPRRRSAFSHEIADEGPFACPSRPRIAFSRFSSRLAGFLPEKNNDAGALSSANPNLATHKKHQCRDHKNTNAYTQKHQCRDHKNTNACARKPHCLHTRCGRGPVPTHVSFGNSRV